MFYILLLVIWIFKTALYIIIIIMTKYLYNN